MSPPPQIRAGPYVALFDPAALDTRRRSNIGFCCTVVVCLKIGRKNNLRKFELVSGDTPEHGWRCASPRMV
jgi:hypothetical protein